MTDLEAYKGLRDIISVINSELDDFKDDDRLSAFINEILYGKVIEVEGHKDLSGGTLTLENEICDLVSIMETEKEIRSLKEVCHGLESGNTDSDNCNPQTC